MRNFSLFGSLYIRKGQKLALKTFGWFDWGLDNIFRDSGAPHTWVDSHHLDQSRRRNM